MQSQRNNRTGGKGKGGRPDDKKVVKVNAAKFGTTGIMPTVSFSPDSRHEKALKESFSVISMMQGRDTAHQAIYHRPLGFVPGSSADDWVASPAHQVGDLVNASLSDEKSFSGALEEYVNESLITSKLFVKRTISVKGTEVEAICYNVENPEINQQIREDLLKISSSMLNAIRRRVQEDILSKSSEMHEWQADRKALTEWEKGDQKGEKPPCGPKPKIKGMGLWSRA